MKVNKFFTRREIIQIGIANAGVSLFPYNKAEAFWPLVLRIALYGAEFIGDVLEGAAVRQVAISGARAIAVSGARALAVNTARRSFLSTTTLALTTAGVVVSVADRVYELAKKYNAKAIWVQGNELQHTFDAILHNDSNEHVQGNFFYKIVDVNSGKSELEKCGCLIHAPQGAKFTYNVKIRELPYTGVKRIESYTESPYIKCQNSDNIVIASRDDVELSSTEIN